MATSPTTVEPGQPHIVSLVLQSKKALQHGELLCTRASTLSNASAQTAIDVLALDAKVKWITDAVLEQVKLAAEVAKSIELKRAQLDGQVKSWDVERTQRSDALDTALESLGAQVVPPDFHSSSSDSSVFGSQNSDDEDNGASEDARRSPFTVKGGSVNGKTNGARRDDERADRKRWKNLRDFVDERAIEDTIEKMESERSALDDILASTAGYPETILETVSAIRDSLPSAPSTSMSVIQEVLKAQEATSTDMAGHLESLATHYGQMAGALRDSEAGEDFSEEDLQEMNRDVEELPSVVAELDQSVAHIQASHERLVRIEADAKKSLETHRQTLDDLDELGDIMSEMLQRQQSLEAECEGQLLALGEYLFTLETLQSRFTAYQFSYNKLLVELGRRRLYREAAEAIVRGMMAQLDAMTDEERLLRDSFKLEHGDHLPTDLCLFVENPPTKWGVVPVTWSVDTEGEANGQPGEAEVLPEVDADLLVEARDRISKAEGGFVGSLSL